MFEGFASGPEANFSEIAKTSLELYDKELSEDYPPEAHDSELWEDFPSKPADSLERVQLRPLNVFEKATLKFIGMTDANIERCMMSSDRVFYLTCINQEYVGTRHPETGILHVEKVIDIDGVRIHGVFPEFSSLF